MCLVNQIRQAARQSAVSAQGVAVLQYDALDAAFESKDVSVYFVDVGHDINHAVDVLQRAEKQFSTNSRILKSRARNTSTEHIAALIKGILLWNVQYDWSNVVPLPVRDMDDVLGLPMQSSGNAPILGIAVFAGKGLVRSDGRDTLRHKCPPGDGAIRIEGVVAELMTKTGLIQRFGA